MSEFVGRETEMDLLARRIAAGEPRPLLITGPRRIGPTGFARGNDRARSRAIDAAAVLLGLPTTALSILEEDTTEELGVDDPRASCAVVTEQARADWLR